MLTLYTLRAVAGARLLLVAAGERDEEFNLPGLWFKERGTYPLLLMHSLLDQLQPDFDKQTSAD